MRESLASRTLKIALYIIFVLGIVGAVSFPFLFDFYFGLFHGAVSLSAAYRSFLMVFVLCVAVPGLWIILEMIGMMRSIPQGPFVMGNVRALKRCGVILLVIATLFLVKCFAFFTFLTMACTFLFLICGFFAFTLAHLFHQAIIYKEENDLTI
ncbi:MAG: DUF2975 domain-containing protein [Defluviitaleaceae bacterium]|nr:DUF2975 domain-containing protein [Defluviitaleaceae bacterium]MCL2240058.1 DUF2975 domain-containing protein [Defluviitaleaceae bacterium]